MTHVRLGIIGVGGMGQFHAGNVLDGKITGCELTAVCDARAENLQKFPALRRFTTAADLFAANVVDAVLVATPHYAHTTVGIAALEAGLHVLVEKPISVHVADARRLAQAHAGRTGQVFAAMFNQRTDPAFQILRRLVRDGELGAVRRFEWTITDWFRTAAYYRGEGWRATWAGEGGGVLLNQCPHNLDIIHWVFGSPRRVTAFCRFGRYHAIEVEDDVTAYLEFNDGRHGTFITSTGEAPGTNRLEIAAERGRVVLEHDRLTWIRNETEMSEFSRVTDERFGRPPTQVIDLTPNGHGGQHVETLQNFVDAIRTGAPLLARGEEGIASVELANAMLLSTWRRQPVALPIDAVEYERELMARAQPRGASAASRS